MINLKANNAETIVEYNTADRQKIKMLQKTIRDIVSYEVSNAEWSPKFKTGVWDGSLSLFSYKTNSFPSGLTDTVLEKLQELDIECSWTDERSIPWRNGKFSSDYKDRQLRDYQETAAQKCFDNSRGIIAIATGGGKTLALAELIVKIQCKPVCIIVPSIYLLRQTANELESVLKENLEKVSVGRIGGGFWSVEHNGINVSTYHSALASYNTKYLESKNKLIYDEFSGEKIKKSIPQLEEELKLAKKAGNLKEVKKIEKYIIDKKTTLDNKASMQKLLETCQVFIVDECHLAPEIIEFLSSKAKNAYYKTGFTATPFREDNQEIRIEGALGRKLLTVTSSELIKRNFLCKPTILMFKTKSETKPNGYQDCYTKNIINNSKRNELIKDFCNELHQNNIPTVILVERLDHGEILGKMIPDSLFVPGKEKGEDDPDDKERDYRERMIAKMANNEIILIATQWIYTGVDCPPIQALILAGSASSSVTTYQQVGRALRLSPKTNKQFALIIDFHDDDRYLKAHGNKRKRTYNLEEEFDLKIIGK